jgi:class 3 adenylate cyclase
VPIIPGLTKTIRFNARPKPVAGIALVYDLEGFSRFVNYPDVGRFIPRYLNHVSEAIQDIVHAGHWSKNKYHPLPTPVHEKFLGDGALYVWTATERKPFPPNFITILCNRLRELRSNFDDIVQEASDAVPITEVPRHIRFGLARGDVYELQRYDVGARRQGKEYVGMCINLASRLQNYCPAARLIVSARVGMGELIREKHSYVKVIAKRIKGFSPEYVILDRAEYEGMAPSVRTKYFTEPRNAA